MSRRRIGLLGGSFNPAHAGHLHISCEAIKRLGVDEIWWLVSPKNPLKAASDLAPYAKRLASAEAMAMHPAIKVTDLEQRHGLHYTIDTLRFLRQRHRDVTFIWLMGADNLKGFHRWKSWKTIAGLVPIAILDRAPYAFSGLAGRFAKRFAQARLPAQAARQLGRLRLPRWCYMTLPRSPISATNLRKTLGDKAFSEHNRPIK